MASYVPERGQAPSSWGDKPRFSASPMEHLEKEKPTAKEQQYLCPRCREGHLRRIQGRNGVFWGCSSYPHCTATFDDEKGKPVL